ncbi:family 2 encapsulin nanocompartment cargo protein polyprenyl transferase [Amycolatopsis sp. NPDC059027]|uniref:family 2 encapsulin nanocompartment cargo protein polyprenyl transferase n=1 Tax=Amycolatopsis sp. NPDC059027 TaxID=3346709 RepID=UPI0036708136
MSATDTRAVERSAGEVLAWSRDLLDPALRAAVDRLPAAMRHISGYHFGWWDERGEPIHARAGKAVRPALVLLCAEAAGGEAVEALPAAVAVELVHNFSLLHDDVMDGDTTRRHRPTAWSVFGTSAAILAGDALLSLAMEILAPGGAAGVRALSTATLELLEGQSEDLEFERRAEVLPDECARMAMGKTGALIGSACALGGLAVGGRPELVERFGLFGRSLGLAFQHVDDLLGIWGDPEVTGKPVFSDLQNRKKSLPVVAALASGADGMRELACLYAQELPLSAPQLARAAELVELTGGRAWSRSQADLLLSEAMQHLAVANPSPRPGAELAALARLLTHRSR